MAPSDVPPRAVFALSAPIGLAFIPLGMALGFLVVHSGLPWWWAPVFAAVIYAGSLEFLMVAAAVTWALRRLPFAALAPMRDSAAVKYLSLHMPVGVMVMLTIYTLKPAASYVALTSVW